MSLFDHETNSWGSPPPPIPPPFPFDSALIEWQPMILVPTEERLRRIAIWYECGCLTPEQLNRLLAEWWTDGGYPQGLGIRRLVRMFKTAGFVSADDEGHSLAPPTAPLTVYRGAEPGNERGLSWSRDRDIAAWFADRIVKVMKRPAGLWETTVPPRHVLGFFDDRNEQEVIVNPFGLNRARMRYQNARDPDVDAAARRHIQAKKVRDHQITEARRDEFAP
jgi:hypothetical protein